MTNEPPENPYAAPQAETIASKPKVIYVNKFNGKLAFWFGLLIGAIVLTIELPTVDGEPAKDARFYILAISIILGTSLLLGALSGNQVQQEVSETEEVFADEPRH